MSYKIMLGKTYKPTGEQPVEKYKIGKKVKFNGGVAKITAVNTDGTATLNWHQPPTNQQKGGFAGTLPSLTQTKPTTNLPPETFDNTETTDTYETKAKKADQEHILNRQYELYNTEGFPNELNLEQSRIRMHNMLINDHSFIQDPDDIPGGCKTCWEEINITTVE